MNQYLGRQKYIKLTLENIIKKGQYYLWMLMFWLKALALLDWIRDLIQI